MDDIFKKLENYINLRNYFWGYVIKYAENNNISKSDNIILLIFIIFFI